MDHFIELNRGFQTAFVDHNINSNVAFRPEFLSNDRFRGKKVIVSLERNFKSVSHLLQKVESHLFYRH